MKTIIANWKMNPQTLAEAEDLFEFTIAEATKHPNIKTIICPPFVFIEELAKLLSTGPKLSVVLGAQDLFWKSKGAFTGEISTEMLKNFGVDYVLVGHSDRRYTIGESDEVINKKIKAALSADITPILLVGECTGENRENILTRQLSSDLAGLSTSQVHNILIAYEPVWAISTNPDARPDTPENTLEAIKFVNDFLAISYKLKAKSYLYGGSISEKNVADFLRHQEINGAVIGGASLRQKEFADILKITSRL